MKTHAIILFLFALPGLMNAQNFAPPVVSDQLTPAISVGISGVVGHKLDASYHNRILAQDVERLVAPFRLRDEASCWQTEFWGKWFTSAVLAYRYHPSPQLKKVLDNAVEGLLSTQTPDGYIGNYAPDKRLAAWDIWGRKYSMLGLIYYYDLTGERKALDAASKVAGHLMKELKEKNVPIVKLGNHRGMAASSVLEPVCLLYGRTGEKRFLDFAEEIVRLWETEEGPQLLSKVGQDVAKRWPKPKRNWYGWEQGQKAYEMMSCYEGLLELYRLTGKPEYKSAVEKTWDNILRTEINIAGSGSAMEAWFGGQKLQIYPVEHYQETCVTATWVKLSQQLLRLTGEAKYADAIEQSFYNSLLGAMNPDGSDWAKYTPLAGQRLEGTEQCKMGLNCCVASGPRGLFTFPVTVVMGTKSGIQVNFFAEGSFSLQTPGKQKVDIIQQTTYPQSGKITMKFQLKKPEPMTVRVRIPAWSSETSLKVNGESFHDVKAGNYAVIERLWKQDDVVELELDMRARLVRLGNIPVNEAIVRGPVVLTRDTRLPGPEIETTLRVVADREGFIKLEPVDPADPDMWMTFKASFIPESYKEGGSKPVEVVLCDYASAGNARHGHPHFRVWMPQLLNPRLLDED